MDDHELDPMEIGEDDDLSKFAMPVFDDTDVDPSNAKVKSPTKKTAHKLAHKTNSGNRRSQSVHDSSPSERLLARSRSDPGEKPNLRAYVPSDLQNIEDDEMETEEVKLRMNSFVDSEDDNYMRFLKSVKCEELIPPSSKIVTLDTKLSMKKAFFALVANEIRSAPLWSSSEQRFVGMLTVTDFIEILRHYYKSPLIQITELEDHRIETWKKLATSSKHAKLISIGPSASLYEAVKYLTTHKIHRLPIIDETTGTVLYIITHKRLIRFLYLHFPDMGFPSYMSQTVEELRIGTYENVAMVSPDTPLIVAHNIIMERRISALPIVNEAGKVMDIYAKFDALNLAEGRSYNNLDVTVRQALEKRSSTLEGVIVCYPNETLSAVINRLVEKQVHRLIVVDSQQHCMGIISLSDLMKFLVLRSSGTNFLC
ncbi:5'-AMP-activated protein kinase subunit gamma-2 [Trichoplax sp. H2]|nr:5'-AMP-activated protein kinase subunit gamma-2 [Trichoplax sp. H2]|eukprot:RDD45743.1 5'-AMP-activated protein kinase subunit gamma-2 [Trichoplax sp. H2]